MMRHADYQMLAVALREGKRELIERGLISREAQTVQEIVQANVVNALLADNPRLDHLRFENETDPYSGWSRHRCPIAVAHAKEVLG